MRVVAHPLVVAAALGLLSPLALADEAEIAPTSVPWDGDDEAPSAEEQARVARAFEAARDAR